MTDTTKSSQVAARRKKRRIAPGLWQLNTDSFEIRVRGINPVTGKIESITVQNLSPGTRYYWRIVGKTMANKTKTGPTWTFTTN